MDDTWRKDTRKDALTSQLVAVVSISRQKCRRFEKHTVLYDTPGSCSSYQSLFIQSNSHNTSILYCTILLARVRVINHYSSNPTHTIQTIQHNATQHNTVMHNTTVHLNTYSTRTLTSPPTLCHPLSSHATHSSRHPRTSAEGGERRIVPVQ